MSVSSYCFLIFSSIIINNIYIYIDFLSLTNLQVIRPFILRRKKDEVEKYLPQKSQVILKCDMSAWQKVYYQQVTDVGRVGLDNGLLQLLLLHACISV